MGNFASTTTFNSEVYNKIKEKIPDSVDSLIKLLNENNFDKDNFDQDKLEPLCRNFINNLVNGDRSFTGLDEVYIGGLSVGLTAYILCLKPTDCKYRDDIEEYIVCLIDIINKQKL